MTRDISCRSDFSHSDESTNAVVDHMDVSVYILEADDLISPSPQDGVRSVQERLRERTVNYQSHYYAAAISVIILNCTTSYCWYFTT